MKFNLFINENGDEEVIVRAKKRSKLTDEIEQLCNDDALELIGYKEKEAVRLNLNDIYCFTVDDNRIFAVTEKERFQLKCRLYNLEDALGESFVKINQSCIASVKKIARFDASIGGSLDVIFKNGYKDYVSRRNLKNVKERLGL